MRFISGFLFGIFLTVLLFFPLSNKAEQRAAGVDDQPTLTILYDPKALEALRTAGGMKVLWWKSADKEVSLGQPRWIIPGKVEPQVAGDGSGVRYYYFDQNTGRKDGPFKPRQR